MLQFDMLIAVIAVTYSAMIFMVNILVRRYPQLEQNKPEWVQRLRNRAGIARVCLLYGVIVIGQHLVI